MIEVLKQTWIYKLQAGDDKKAAPEFTSSGIKEIVYEEDRGIPSILITLKDGTQRLDHPYGLNLKELEAVTTWAENLKTKPSNRS
jgi:hypothetical protein